MLRSRSRKVRKRPHQADNGPRRRQVFTSSTYTDLKEERQAAIEAVLAAGHIPARIELFVAGNKSQQKTIEK